MFIIHIIELILDFGHSFPSHFGRTTVRNAYTKTKTTVNNAYNRAKTAVSNTYNKAKTTVSNAYGQAKTWAQNTGETLHSWGSSKLKEADNILNSWTASVEKTVKHFCTTANRVKEDVVEFVKNIDWKKVAVGVGVTMAFTGVVLLSGGSAAPVLLSAAIGSGSGAVFNGVLTAMNGGSIADIAESASDGFMWGGIGGSLGGSTTVLLSELAAAGSSLIGNPFFQRLVQGAADTAVDTAQSASKGLPVTLEGVLINMTYNTLMAGGIGSGGKQAVNEAVDETADSIGDSVRREVKSGSTNGSNSKNPMMGDDWHNYFNQKYGTDNVTWESASIQDIVDMPSKITDFSPKQISELTKKNGWSVDSLGKGSLAGVPYEQGGGLSMHAPNGSSVYIQYHPGGGHHGEMPYYKISSGPNGIVRYYTNGERAK